MIRHVVGWGVLLAGAALLALGFLDHRGTHEPEPLPTLALGHHDFGSLASDARETHEFRLRNPGPAAWTLLRTGEDCGCARVVSASAAVQAGEDMVVVVDLDARSRSPGPVASDVFALVEPGPTLLKGSIAARIVASIRVTPSPLVVTLGEDETRFEARLAVLVPFDWPAPAVAPVGTEPDLALAVDPPRDRSAVHEFSVLLSGELPLDRESREWTQEFEVVAREQAPQRQTVSATLLVRRRPRVSVSPSMLWLDRGPPRAVGELFLRRVDGAVPETVTWELDPEGAAELEYDATRGRVALRLAEGAPERVELTLLADGGRHVVPVIVSSGRAR